MMAETHCAQCSDTRNIYIKTCDCSKKIDKHKLANTDKHINITTIVETDKRTEQPKLKAVKAIVYKVVRVYETVPSKTMKFAAALTLLLVLVAVFSIALAQNKEETKSQYGMAFPLEDSASMNSEQRVAIIGSVPGEGAQPSQELNRESLITTTLSPSTEDSAATVTTVADDSDKNESEVGNNEGPTFIIADDNDEDKPQDGSDEKANPRLVFIERLMGLHVSAPLAGQNGEKEQEDNNNLENASQSPLRNPFDKLNAKWASRMRKFSIPLMQQQAQQQQSPMIPENPNPLLRYAAAAMMTRLLAAAARAHNNGPMAKDKDDDSDDETVPVLVATVRANIPDRPPLGRPMPPMYGRPMPIRPNPIMRAPIRPPMNFGPQARISAAANVPQRIYSAPINVMPQRAPVMQRPVLPYQQVLVLLAHVPVPIQAAESRMSVSPVSINPYYSAPQHSMPFYHGSQYSPMGLHQMQRHVMPVEVPVPVHMPVASYHRPVYQHPYQAASYHRPMMTAPSRPVIEIPVEIPVPIHVPIPVSVNARYQNHDNDHDASPSEHDQVAIVYYDPEGNDANDHDDHLEPQTSESEHIYRITPGQKDYSFLSRPMPDTQSATKLKLWREYVGAKHAAQPGVRYIPVAVATDESQPPNAGHDSQFNHNENSEPAESQHQPAFVILADDGPDAPHDQQQH